METVRGRFAPSPSGEMHLGNAWSALLAWLDIRKLGGAMVLRMEDLDPDRCRPDHAEQVIADLRWLGLDWDEGPYWQSRRTEHYQTAFDSLAAQDLLYPCWCTRAELRAAVAAPHVGEDEVPYNGACCSINALQAQAFHDQGRRPSWRIKAPDRTFAFQDEVFGPVSQNLRHVCGDFPVRRSDGAYAYQLAVVVDDIAMQVTRVVRGADLLASTPRQLYLYELLGGKPPAFAHVPLLIGADGARLSKRHGSLSLNALRKQGVSAENVLGRLAVWAGVLDRFEPVTATELVPRFSWTRMPCQSIVVVDAVDF